MPENIANHTIYTHDVSRETFQKIDQSIQQNQRLLIEYIDQLLWWNKRINLVSRGVSRETLWEHIRHSLLLTALPGFKKPKLIVDAGTGGGLPGIPLAVVTSDKKFVLNDIVTKKVMAVKQIVETLKIDNVSMTDCHIQELTIQEPFLLVSKHAFKIDELWHFSNKLSCNELVFFKGIDFREELEKVKKPLHVDCYNIQEAGQGSFYRGKVILFISTDNQL